MFLHSVKSVINIILRYQDKDITTLTYTDQINYMGKHVTWYCFKAVLLFTGIYVLDCLTIEGGGGSVC